jgi:hypothetical protein
MMDEVQKNGLTYYNAPLSDFDSESKHSWKDIRTDLKKYGMQVSKELNWLRIKSNRRLL